MKAQVWKTDNGVEITPGLRVFTNDWSWWQVGHKQFTERDRNGEPYVNSPGGLYFDGWFRCYKVQDNTKDGPVDEDNQQYTIYNGERMTTVKPRSY